MLRYFGVLRIQYACILVASYVRLFIYRYGREAGSASGAGARGGRRATRHSRSRARVSLSALSRGGQDGHGQEARCGHVKKGGGTQTARAQSVASFIARFTALFVPWPLASFIYVYGI